jgi:hypothetical protein
MLVQAFVHCYKQDGPRERIVLAVSMMLSGLAKTPGRPDGLAQPGGKGG